MQVTWRIFEPSKTVPSAVPGTWTEPATETWTERAKRTWSETATLPLPPLA
jgi:hypothetical protein